MSAVRKLMPQSHTVLASLSLRGQGACCCGHQAERGRTRRHHAHGPPVWQRTLRRCSQTPLKWQPTRQQSHPADQSLHDESGADVSTLESPTSCLSSAAKTACLRWAQPLRWACSSQDLNAKSNRHCLARLADEASEGFWPWKELSRRIPTLCMQSLHRRPKGVSGASTPCPTQACPEPVVGTYPRAQADMLNVAPALVGLQVHIPGAKSIFQFQEAPFDIDDSITASSPTFLWVVPTVRPGQAISNSLQALIAGLSQAEH